MKKQINPTIKAHLIRGAFYLLLLLAVCAIPFALAQSRNRGTTKQSVAKPNAPANMYMPQVSQRTDGAVSDQPLPNISQTEQSQLPTSFQRSHGSSVIPDAASAKVTAGHSVRSVKQPWHSQHQLAGF